MSIEVRDLRFGYGSGEVLRGVKRAVDGFVKEAEQFDDLTMMCLVYHGPQGLEKTEEQW